MVSIRMYKGARTYYIIAAIRNDACKNINYHFATTIIHLKCWFPSSLCFLSSSSMRTWRHTYYLYARYIVMWLETHRSASRAIRYRTLTCWKRKTIYVFMILCENFYLFRSGFLNTCSFNISLIFQLCKRGNIYQQCS